MNTRWAVILGLTIVLGLAVIPVLAQMPGGPGFGWSGMGGRMMGGWAQQGNGQPIAIERATDIARQAVAQSGFTGLTPGHIMEFGNHFYVAVKEKATGRGAFELLIDRYTGVVHPEPGPNMMWNTQYGHMSGTGMMGGMMGGFGSPMMVQPTSPAAATLTLAQARVRAQQFLDARLPGTRTAEDIVFPGYYTIDVARNGKMVGMLSVNAYTGQVWYHAWHGTFVQERDIN